MDLTKEAPSVRAILSPEKRRIMSELVVARNNIKSKFERAYSDRKKFERETRKLFKPITSSIDELKIDEVGKKKKKLESGSGSGPGPEPDGSNQKEAFVPKRLSPSTPKSILKKANKGYKPLLQRVLVKPSGLTPSFKPRRLSTSTPRSILGRTNYMSINSTENDNFGTPQSAILGTAPPQRPSTPRSRPSPKTLRSPKTRGQQRMAKGIDLNQFHYVVKGDNDSIDNYHLRPLDDVMADVVQRSVIDDSTKDIKLEWKYVPKYAQNEWINLRKQKQRRFERINRSSDDREGAVGGISGAGIESLNFDFIPYNVKNRIIYEYFDDPNELCDRLRLLFSSRMAGNSNHMQEINSIIEELREVGCIV